MTIEQAMIAQARPQMLVTSAMKIIEAEVCKGCLPILAPRPVAMEPVFLPLALQAARPPDIDQLPWQYEEPQPADLVRFEIWISPEWEFDWTRCERFIKQLQAVRHRFGLEIVGNKKQVMLCLLCRAHDAEVVRAAFQGEFKRCELSRIPDHPVFVDPQVDWTEAAFLDYYPPPPYTHLLTRPPELHSSPLEPLLAQLACLPDTAYGLCQILAQPVSPGHSWHRNVEILLDLEYTIKLSGGMHLAQRYGQQVPSGDLRNMAYEVSTKAHNDKPFFVAALRVAVVGAGQDGEDLLRSLTTFTGLFQHGGHPLQCIDHRRYAQVIDSGRFREMFLAGLVYRPAFLLNSEEMSGLLHIPPAEVVKHRPVELELLETLPVKSGTLNQGTLVGYVKSAGSLQEVRIDLRRRCRHTHTLGRPDMGKSNSLENTCLDDLEQGHGVAVLDPHGDLVERLLMLIPEKDIGRVIYLDPGDPDWVPIWNPLARIPGQGLARMADDIVNAIKGFVSSGGWGDRLEHLLRNMFYGVMHLPGATFFDVYNLLRNTSHESKLLREEILKVLDNEAARTFWLHDFGGYKKDELGPPKNKLSKLMISETVSLMLSQPESRFNLRQMMDQGLILLVDLSKVGTNLRDVLGCFLLSMFHCTALGRSDTPPDKRKPFFIYLDEAHRFVAGAIDDLIAETRKYSVGLLLAHQFLSQFGQTKTDALSSVGSTIIFNLDSKDARYLTKDLRDLVRPEDISSLGQGEAIARIGTDIVRFRTLPPRPLPDKHFREEIIAESRRRYYRPAHEVRREIRNRNGRWTGAFPGLTPVSTGSSPDGPAQELVYEEWN